MPWKCIRFLSRFIAFLAYKVFAYRRRLVEENITLCFPQKNEAERRLIVKDFYNHLVSVLLSSPKLLSLSKEVIKEKHLHAKGLECFSYLQAKGKKHFIVLTGHCGNWELFSAGQVYFDDLGLRQEQLYRPLKNKAFDDVQKDLRSHYGAIATPKAKIGRRMLEVIRNKDSEGTVFAFISDQTPSKGHVGLWTNFLNRETAFLDGAERLAKKFDLPVIYLDVTRKGETLYEGSFKIISESAKDEDDGFITQSYVRLLEETIKRSPSEWLWSHKRWKFTREEDTKSV